MLKLILYSFLSISLCCSAEVITANKPVNCYNVEDVAKEIKKLKEELVFSDFNIMTDDSTILFFKNEVTGTWTLFEAKDTIMCVLAYGKQNKL